MRLAEQWAEILAGLPLAWIVAHLALEVEDEAKAERASLVLGPASAGRAGPARFHLDVHRGRGLPGPTAEVMWRCLQRLDDEGIAGRLELVSAEAPAEETRAAHGRPPLAVQWKAILERLPADWSDLYVEVELDSTDFLERGALLLAPVNPARFGGPRGLRFRCAKSFGYGVAPGMAERCLERLDKEGITGVVRVVRVLSDSAPAMTQGPVFRIGGRSV